MPEVIIAREAGGGRRVVFECVGKSMTEQAHLNEVDINQIVARYQRTGVLPTRGAQPVYGDFTGVVDYHSAVESVRAADAAFMALPPEVRRRFSNDPAAMLEFLADSDNREEAVRLGLVAPVEPDEPPVEVVEGSGGSVEAGVEAGSAPKT